MLKVRLQLPVLELQKYCCRTRVDNITIPLAWAPFCVENTLRAVLRFPAGVRDLYVLYSVDIGPWSNPTSCAVHIEGYFVLGKTD
jgi:hypothetical protein